MYYTTYSLSLELLFCSFAHSQVCSVLVCSFAHHSFARLLVCSFARLHVCSLLVCTFARLLVCSLLVCSFARCSFARLLLACLFIARLHSFITRLLPTCARRTTAKKRSKALSKEAHARRCGGRAAWAGRKAGQAQTHLSARDKQGRAGRGGGRAHLRKDEDQYAQKDDRAKE